MAGFPLMNIGTGLTGFMGGFQQAQQAAQQRQMMDMYLQKQRAETEGQDAQLQAILAGALSPNSPIKQLAQAPGFPTTDVSPPVVPQPPMPGAGSVPRTTDNSFGSDPSGASAPPQMNRGVDAEVPQVMDPAAALPPTPTPMSTVGPAPQGGADTGGADTSGGAAEGGGTQQQGGRGGFDITQILHQVDPKTIAQAVMTARPNISPQAAMSAVSSLYAMSLKGSGLERAEAAMMLNYLAKQQGFDLRGRGLDIQQQSADTRRTQGDQRIAQGDRKIEQGDTRLDQGQQRIDETGRHRSVTEAQGDRRLGQGDTRIDQAQQRIDAKAKRLMTSADPSVAKRASALRARRQAILDQSTVGGIRTDEQSSQMQAIDKEIEQLYAREAARLSPATPQQ